MNRAKKKLKIAPASNNPRREKKRPWISLPLRVQAPMLTSEKEMSVQLVPEQVCHRLMELALEEA